MLTFKAFQIFLVTYTTFVTFNFSRVGNSTVKFNKFEVFQNTFLFNPVFCI